MLFSFLSLNSTEYVIQQKVRSKKRSHELYECIGDVPNIVFPCVALADSYSGKIVIYYGAADTSVALAFTTIDEVVIFIKEHDLIK